jgi:hypothetical protein
VRLRRREFKSRSREACRHALNDAGRLVGSRDLGLTVAALRIEDGLSTPREVSMCDPLLCIGFHALEAGCRRWTAGRARLPVELWEGCAHGFYMRLELAGLPIPRWLAPVTATPRPSQVMVA